MIADRGPTARLGDHAVVVGGSLAGMAAAGALAPHFDRVTIVERDRLPDRPAWRTGVPQGRHVHGLMAGGQQALERLFAGFSDELLALGAVPLRFPRDFLWLAAGGWCHRFPATHQILACSRSLIEWVLCRRLAAMSNVEVTDGHTVDALLSEDGARRITGVQLRARGLGLPSSRLRADLVVDASGRSSRTPQLLESLGYPSPAQVSVDSQVGYASRLYRRPERVAGDWKMLWLQNRAPADLRAALLVPIEGDRWHVSLFGVGGDHPPTDDRGFVAWARTLRSPILYETIKDAEPCSPVSGYRATANRRRHYERMPRWPERLIVIGDAVCAFNPVYAQGMSVAAVTGVALAAALRETSRLDGFARRFQRTVAACGADAWMRGVTQDLRFPTTTGARADGLTQFMHRYTDRVLELALVDPQVNRAFGEVQNLLAPARSLFAHDIALRVARGPQVSPPGEPTAWAEPVAACV